MKKEAGFFGIVVSIVFLLTLNIHSSYAGSFSLGNLSSNITDVYNPGANLAGWINLSLNNFDADSKITLDNSNISLKDLIKNINSNLPYTCTIIECGYGYSSLDSGASSKTFSLNSGASKLMGMKIIGDNIGNIINFSMTISSNAVKSCSNPLEVDFLNQENYIFRATLPAHEYDCPFVGKFGGYEDSFKISDPAVITTKKFCNKISFVNAPDLKIGASLITSSGTANFTMSLLDSDRMLVNECNLSIVSSGDYGCVINNSITENDYYVCINKINGDEYKINYENHDGKGYWEDNSGSYDWQIFGQPGSYAPFGSIILNNNTITDIESKISSYLNNVYASNCSSGCIIPLKFTSKSSSQQIDLTNANIKYSVLASQPSENKIYEVSQASSLINMPYSQVYLDNSGLKVPEMAGNYNISLKLNGTEILKKSIRVIGVPSIQSLYPLEVPAAIEYTFFAVASGNITGYSWDFGDNSSAQTNVSYVKHKYVSIGTHTLTLTARNSNGENNKSFSIAVVSPENYINATINKYKQKLTTLNSGISSFPTLVKNYLNSRFNLTTLDSTLTSLRVSYESAAGDSAKYIEIMNSLADLNIPNSINITSKLNGKFIADKAKIKLTELNSLSSEDFGEDESKAQNAIFAWDIQNLDINSQLEVYSAIYDSSVTPIVSYAKFSIKPSVSIDKLYMIVNSADAVFNQESSPAGESKGIILSDLSEDSSRDVEFIVPSGFNIIDLPVYLAPSKSALSLGIDIAKCNNNGKCDSGETWKNCRSDCKPWVLSLIWILVALFIVFFLYIICQEWYKRRYENYLFKNKNDLYNIINFLSNSEKQGIDKNDAFSKLKDKDWAGEQIIYAYKKFKGKRTGMWEIPIFKFLENKKVNSEIQVRNQQPMNLIPQPSRPFVNNNFKQNFKPNQFKNNFKPINPKDVQKSVFGNPARITNQAVKTTVIQTKPSPISLQSNQPAQKNVLTQKPIETKPENEAGNKTDKKVENTEKK